MGILYFREFTASNISVNMYTVNIGWLYDYCWCAGMTSVTTNRPSDLSNRQHNSSTMSRVTFLATWICVDVVSALIILAMFVVQWNLHLVDLLICKKSRLVSSKSHRRYRALCRPQPATWHSIHQRVTSQISPWSHPVTSHWTHKLAFLPPEMALWRMRCLNLREDRQTELRAQIIVRMAPAMNSLFSMSRFLLCSMNFRIWRIYQRLRDILDNQVAVLVFMCMMDQCQSSLCPKHSGCVHKQTQSC